MCSVIIQYSRLDVNKENGATEAAPGTLHWRWMRTILGRYGLPGRCHPVVWATVARWCRRNTNLKKYYSLQKSCAIWWLVTLR